MSAGLDGAIHRAVVSFCGDIAAGVRIFNMFISSLSTLSH